MRSLLGAEIEIFTKDRESSVEAWVISWFCLILLRALGWSGRGSFFCDSVDLNAQFALSHWRGGLEWGMEGGD